MTLRQLDCSVFLAVFCLRLLLLLLCPRGGLASPDAEVMEFEDELADPEFACHWSLWTDKACESGSFDRGARCRAHLTRKCVCLKFSEKRRHNTSGYEFRTCNFGTFQSSVDKPNGRCDSNCQLLDAFFRRLDGLDGAWCPWSKWQRETCLTGSEGLFEGYQLAHRDCLCPPPWLEGAQCQGPDTRAGNCRESQSDVRSGFLDAWQAVFASAVLGVALPLPLVAWFCCLAGPLRRGIQYGRLQSTAVAAELRALQVEVQRRKQAEAAAAAQQQREMATEAKAKDKKLLTYREATRPPAERRHRRRKKP